MKKKLIILAGILSIIGISVALYMFNMPHRDVAASKADYTVNATELVQEFVQNNDAANDKYLAEDGNSKILIVNGKVNSISLDQNGQKVVLLKGEGELMGVSVTFTTDTNAQLDNISIGEALTVKGVIRSGAGYDEDLDLAEDVIVEKGSIEG